MAEAAGAISRISGCPSPLAVDPRYRITPQDPKTRCRNWNHFWICRKWFLLWSWYRTERLMSNRISQCWNSADWRSITTCEAEGAGGPEHPCEHPRPMPCEVGPGEAASALALAAEAWDWGLSACSSCFVVIVTHDSSSPHYSRAGPGQLRPPCNWPARAALSGPDQLTSARRAFPCRRNSPSPRFLPLLRAAGSRIAHRNRLHRDQRAQWSCRPCRSPVSPSPGALKRPPRVAPLLPAAARQTVHEIAGTPGCCGRACRFRRCFRGGRSRRRRTAFCTMTR